MALKLETFNILWEAKIGRKLTKAEFDGELEEFPDLIKNYSAQEKVAKKYRQ